MKIWFTLSMLALFSAASAHAATLKIQITGLRSWAGHVLLDLHNDPSAFPEDSAHAFRSIKIKAAPTINVTINNVPEGTYAFTYIHDENDNGVMDMNPLGIPLEGFGFSRDPKFGMSAPSFGASAFDVNTTGAVVASHMRYLN